MLLAELLKDAGIITETEELRIKQEKELWEQHEAVRNQPVLQSKITVQKAIAYAQSYFLEIGKGTDPREAHIIAAMVNGADGKTDAAIANYKRAVEIEDSYRRQFEIMYPGRKIFSRLGEEKYQLAKQKIKSLPPQPAP
jgi:hypothetical protein